MLLAKIPTWKRVLTHALGLIAALGFYVLWAIYGNTWFKSLECLGYTTEECEMLRSVPSGPHGIEFMILAVWLSQLVSYLVVWYLTRLVLGTTRWQRRNMALKN